MKLAVKQPSESMPNVLHDEEMLAEEEFNDHDQETEQMEGDEQHPETEDHLVHEEEGDDVPMTIPADVSCVVPGCGRRHGRMCTFPVEGDMRAAWTSVLEAVFPDLDVNAAEPKLKLLCEDHFDATDFDERGLIQPAAVPTRFPGGVKVIYNSGGGGADEDPTPEPEQKPEPEPEEPEPEPIRCCVPRCPTMGPPDSMFEFPDDNHRAWTSIVSAATNKNNWRKDDVDPITKRPLNLRVCKEHFSPESFESDARDSLKDGAHPSLFDGGKKKVILRPSTNKQEPAKKTSSLAKGKKSAVRQTPKGDPVVKKQGPVFVNVTDDGLQLLHKNGASIQLPDLTLSELRRIRDCVKDKLRTDVTEAEKKNLDICLTQVTPVLEEREKIDSQNQQTSHVMNDVMALNPDMNDVDVKRLVESIKQVDGQRREYERSLSRFFEESDNYARESEAVNGKINAVKRNISVMETTFLRFFKYNDQRRALMGASSVKWSVSTLTIARDIIQKVGKTAYGRLLRMGFPLPAADVVTASMERAHAQSVPVGLVEVLEENRGGTGGARPAAPDSAQRLQNGSTEEGDSAPSAKKAKLDDCDPDSGGGGDDGGEKGDMGALQGVTAEHLQAVLAGKGTLQDSHGRTIKVSLAEVPGAPPGAKTVVMETPDDAGEVRYVPSAEA